MMQVFKTILSMSLSGAALISLLLLGRRFWKGKLGRQWQYYIWMIVVLRLLLPFGPEVSLLGKVYQDADRAVVKMMQEERQVGSDNGQSPKQSSEKDTVQRIGQYSEQSAAQESLLFSEQNEEESGMENGEKAAPTAKYLWAVWLAVACGMLIRKISMYQSYIKYVKSGAAPVNDMALLNQLAMTAQELGTGRPVELCANPLVASPMLVGYFHPCIILPDASVSEKEFHWIAMHELTHYRRRDIVYKWLVQLAVCLHWFNPLVYVMSREIDRACEFACDEAVIGKAGHDHAKDYGETLLKAMVAAGTHKEPFAVVTMSANKELLKERLGAIMNGGKKTKRAGIIMAGLTVCIALGAVFIGVYPAVAAEQNPVMHADKTGVSESDSSKAPALSADGGTLTWETADAGRKAPVQEKPEGTNAEVWTDAEKAYKAGSLPMFHIAFYELDEKAQEKWLDRFYADEDIAFFSSGIMALDADSPLIQTFAERFYADGDIAFFSALADRQMTDKELEGWLERALADDKWDFQSMLYDRLHQDEEKDELDKALAEEQLAQYQAVGVTKNGKNYYYEGQLVNIFLDIHMPNRSFFTLDMNPAGTVNIRIVRSADGQVTGVAYMTETEVKELLGDMYGDGEEDSEADDSEAATGAGAAEADEQENEVFPRKMVVSMPVCRIRAGAGEDSPVVGLLGEGETVTVLGKKEGGGRMWYLLDKESLAEKPDEGVKACYIRADLLR